MVEMVKLGMNKYNIINKYDIINILSNDYRIQQNYPDPERDSVEYLKHFNDNLWAYQMAHLCKGGFTTLTDKGADYLTNVFIIYCDVIGIHPYTLKPLDGSEGDPEIIGDEDE